MRHKRDRSLTAIRVYVYKNNCFSLRLHVIIGSLGYTCRSSVSVHSQRPVNLESLSTYIPCLFPLLFVFQHAESGGSLRGFDQIFHYPEKITIVYSS